MERIGQFALGLFLGVYILGWLKFYDEQPTWWDLVVWFGS